MSQGESTFFDIVTIVFFVLTLSVGIVVLGIASDSIEPPILAPADDEPLPTQAFQLTLTPSPVPGEAMPAMETPAPDSQ